VASVPPRAARSISSPAPTGGSEDITRQLHLIADAHGAELVRMPELAMVAPLLDERRYHWTDAAGSLAVQAVSRGRRRRIVA